MAFTATMTIAKTTVKQGEPFQCVVVISNSGGSDGTLQYVKPVIKQTGGSDPTSAISSSAQQMSSGSFVSPTVPAGSSLTLRFDLQIYEVGTSFDVDCDIQISGQTLFRCSAPDTIAVTQTSSYFTS